jgi:hypothetical protein
MTQKASVTPPLFEASAKEILARLEDEDSEEALAMKGEARFLVSMFRAWMLEQPSDLVKHEIVSRLFALYRRMLNHLLQKRS